MDNDVMRELTWLVSAVDRVNSALAIVEAALENLNKRVLALEEGEPCL